MSSKKTDFFSFPGRIGPQSHSEAGFGGEKISGTEIFAPLRSEESGRDVQKGTMKKRKAGTVRTEGKVPGGQKRFENSQKMSMAGK